MTVGTWMYVLGAAALFLWIPVDAHRLGYGGQRTAPWWSRVWAFTAFGCGVLGVVLEATRTGWWA